MSISPSCSARSTASWLPYLMNWISSKAGSAPRKFGLRSIRMIRPRSYSVTMYGPLPTSGSSGWYWPVRSLSGTLPQTCSGRM